MQSIDNKKARSLENKGLIDCQIQKESKMTLSSLNQNTAKPNTQPLVIGNFSIRQDEGGRYSLADLHKASGNLAKHKPSNFLRVEQTKELIQEIEQVSDMSLGENNHFSNMRSAVKVIHGGNNRGTYVVKELVYSYAMWISAKFHLTVIRAYDAMVMQWQINDRQSISPEQQALLHEIVARRSSGERKIFAEMWARHNRHFKIPRYSELLAIHFPESIHYLETMELKSKVTVEPNNQMDNLPLVENLINKILQQNCMTSSLYRAAHAIDPDHGKYLSDLAFETNIALLKLSRALSLKNQRGEKLVSDDLKTANYTTGNQHYGSRWFHPLMEAGKLMGALQLART